MHEQIKQRSWITVAMPLILVAAAMARPETAQQPVFTVLFFCFAWLFYLVTCAISDAVSRAEITAFAEERLARETGRN